MKQLLILFAFLFLFLLQSNAQSPVYFFNVTVDTAIESNSYIIAGYVKTDTPTQTPDSVIIMLRSGSPRSTHMDTANKYVIHFNSGQDSVPFTIHIMSDTFPEYPEHVTYTITAPTNGASIGADSTLTFVLIDTTPPAVISLVIDTGSAWLHSDTFSVCATINNPNPFYIRYYTRTYDCWFYTPLAHLTACGGGTYNYTYDWDTLYAPPGISTICENIHINADNSLAPDKTMMVVIQNIDANTILDSTFLFTIKNDNYYTPPSISFDINALTVRSDTATIVSIPITIVNYNYPPYTFEIDTIDFTSNTTINNNSASHFSIINPYITPGYGIWHDTIHIFIPTDRIILDTFTATLSISNVAQNISPDTLFTLTIIDSGSLSVSFYGAALSHLKSDSIGYIHVYTSSPVKYPVSVNVTYLNGNAIRDTDFRFNDTTVIFPANNFDTITLPVFMLQDHLHSGNTQLNLQLSNVTPSNIQFGISQYTYIIIDNEDSTLAPLDLIQIDIPSIGMSPNPVNHFLNINTTLLDYSITITNDIGQKIYDLSKQNGEVQLDFINQSGGIYFVRIFNTQFSYIAKVLKL